MRRCYLRGMDAATSPTVTVLGIESSCDDTCAAVIRASGDRVKILSSVVIGQATLHQSFGGVVPEIAARAHAERLDGTVARALAEAGLGLGSVDLMAVTSGPGLIGGLVAGVVSAKAISAVTSVPLVGVNHLAGHALSPMIGTDLAFPYLLLLVSGGHCQFLIVEAADRFVRLGGTIDDAPGEAFDKVAKTLGLAQPGGPEVEREAASGDGARFALPRPLMDRPGMDLSFSGLKTAVVRERDRLVEAQGGLRVQDRADLCASFQAAVAEVLTGKSARAIAAYLERSPVRPTFCVAGGVAANRAIRAPLERVAREAGCAFVAPPMALCTDNAVMIAWAGLCRYRLGLAEEADLIARPRWPLDQASAPMLGSGKKGAKA
jgi:N6-L-threonylcarbamoyladenine synthase